MNTLTSTIPTEEAGRWREQQAAGIAAARERGVQFGRPRKEAPANFAAIVSEWEGKRISLPVALRLCGMSSSTFFRRVRESRRGFGE